MGLTLDPGKFRHVVTILRDDGMSSDSSGQPLPDFQPVATFHALVCPLSGRQQFYADQNITLSGYSIYMRASIPVYSYDKISWNGRTLNIVSVIPVGGLNEFYEITATEQNQPQGL